MEDSTPPNFFKENLKVLTTTWKPHIVSKIVMSRKKNPEHLLGNTPEFSDEQIEDAEMLVILGVGDGKHLPELVSRYNRWPRFLIIEKSWNRLAAAFAMADWSNIVEDPRNFWVIGKDDPAELRTALFGCVDPKARKIKYIRGHEEENDEYYEDALKIYIDVGRMNLRNHMANPEDAYEAMFNMARNAEKLIDTPLSENLADAFKGKPGIVIAAGPSLNQSMDLLRENQDKAVLMCCDNIVTTLQRQGIKPHFVASVERHPFLGRFFEGYEQKGETWMLAPPFTCPETLEAWGGPHAFISRGHAYIRNFYPEYTGRAFGNSVAHLCIAGLKMLGCEPIILVGQDLAYDPYTKASYVEGVHASQTIEKDSMRDYLLTKESEEEKEGTHWVESNNGEKILTRPDLLRFLRQTVSMLSYPEYKDSTIINAIPEDYGAKIENAEQRNPVDVFKEFCTETLDIREQISEALQPTQEYSRHRAKELVESCDDFINFVENKIGPEFLKILDRISVFILYHLPSGKWKKGELEQAHREFFTEIEHFDNTLASIDKKHWGMMFCFVQYSKILASRRFNELNEDPRNMAKKNMLYYDVLRAHYSECWSWSKRLATITGHIRAAAQNRLDQIPKKKAKGRRR